MLLVSNTGIKQGDVVAFTLNIHVHEHPVHSQPVGDAIAVPVVIPDVPSPGALQRQQQVHHTISIVNGLTVQRRLLTG